MRPFVPVPATRDRSTPSSRASWRTEGPACARENPGSLIGARSVRPPGIMVGRTGTALAGAAAAAMTGAPAATCAGTSGGAARNTFTGTVASGVTADGSAPAAALSTATRSPLLTLPPFARCSTSTRPAALDGTSIVAFSVSSVTSGVSISTTSPTFTRISITATSLKSPRSGTRISSRFRMARSVMAVSTQVFSGFGLEASMPSVDIAFPTVARSTLPSSASALSVASTMKRRSTSK